MVTSLDELQKNKQVRIGNDNDNNKTKNPFQRLVTTQTISSFARRVATKLPKSPPPDSLDLALASQYDHHSVWGAARAYVVKQERSCVVDHAAEFKKQPIDVEYKSRVTDFYKESRETYRNDSYHAQVGIPPHHTSSSRRGYGRSPDGCFYTS